MYHTGGANNLKTIYKNLLKTEQNMCKTLELLGDKVMGADELAKLTGWSGFTTRKSLRLLAEAGSVEEIKGKAAKGNNMVFYKYVKPYIPRTLEEISDKYEIKSSATGYGTGEWWTPWLPKLPEAGQPKVHKLLDTKDKDYFHTPLKKSAKVGVGSTFSLMDMVTA